MEVSRELEEFSVNHRRGHLSALIAACVWEEGLINSLI